MSTAPESQAFLQPNLHIVPEGTVTVDEELDRISAAQQEAEVRKFYTLNRLRVIGSMPTRSMLKDGTTPLGAGDVLPSFT